MEDFTVVAPVAAELGEGLHWDAVRECLWLVDIVGQRLLAVTPGKTGHWERRLPQRVGWVLPEHNTQRLLLGLQQGVARLGSPDADELMWVTTMFDGNPSLRLNDAKADSIGAVWAGSLNHDDESRPDGALYRIDLHTGLARQVDSGYQVANGPAIHPGGRWMLHTDSGRRTIHAFDLDVAAGAISGKRTWKQLTPAEGYPDGMCFDADGCVWVAHWGAGCISRFAPDGGLMRRVHLPASNITNVCFGGPALDRLFVTSARVGLPADALQAQPLAGALFEVEAAGVRGLPSLPAGPSR